MKAIEVDPAERDRFLSDACLGDEELRCQVERLLEADEEMSRLKIPPAINDLLTIAAPIPPLRHGQLLNERYRVIEVIGEGGMGVVYKAEQQDPKRVVAVKVIRPDVWSESVRDRFSAEKEILGQFAHRGIATIYEAGAFEHSGFTLPFFAMEYVDGRPVTEHVRAARLCTESILRLLLEICEAVRYAHERGIIHCDLKPANILADSDGRITVLDFGIAVVTDERLGGRLRADPTGQRFGTRGFMSPGGFTLPQAPATPQKDVYSIGVIAREMLTGRSPSSVATKSLVSDAVGQTAEFSAEDAPPALDWELQAILDQATTEDRSRRYATVAKLASDFESYRKHLPVDAVRPWPMLYRARKWTWRHRWSLHPAAAVLGLVLVVVIPTLVRTRALVEKNAESASRYKATATRTAAVLGHSQYAADSVKAMAAWDKGDIASVLLFLQYAQSSPEQQSLRSVEWHHLWRLCHQYSSTCDGHAGSVKAVFVTRNDELAIVGSDAVIRWAPNADFAERVLQLPIGSRTLCASADGKTVVTVDTLHRIEIWDLPSHRVRASLLEDPSEDWTASVSDDGTRLCVVSRSGVARVWNLNTMQQTGAFPVSRGMVMHMAVSHDGRRLVVDDGRAVILWDVAAGDSQGLLPVSAEDVSSMSYGPLDVIAVGLRGGSVVLVDTVRLCVTKTLKDLGEGLGSLAFDGSGALLAIGGTAGVVTIWDIASGTQKATLKGHASEVTAMRFFPDALSLVTGDTNGQVKVWDLRARYPSPPLKTHYVDDIQIVESERIVRVLAGKEILNWDPRTGDTRKVALRSTAESSQAQYELSQNVQTCAFLADGPAVVTCSRAGQVELWDAITGLRTATLGSIGAPPSAIVCDPDGKRVAVGDETGSVTVWRVDNRRVAGTVKTGDEPVKALTWTPDGAMLVAGSKGGSIQLLDAQTWQPGKHFTLSAPGMLTLSVSPDSTSLIAAGGGRTAAIWELATGREVQLASPPHYLMCATFNPDGRTVASGDENGITIWDVAMGDQRARWECKGLVKQLVFSADGKTLVAAQYDGVVHSFGLVPGNTHAGSGPSP